MGELAEKYGYADGGEALAVADKDEVWLFEITGPGPLWNQESGKPGAIWAAQRVPDDMYGMGSNRSRIGEINFNDKDNFMYSSNIREFAKDMGWWKQGEKFVFLSLIHILNTSTFSASISLMKAAQVRSASSPFSRPGQVLLKLRISI